LTDLKWRQIVEFAQRPFFLSLAIKAPTKSVVHRNGNPGFAKAYYCPPWQSQLPRVPFLLAEAIEASVNEIIARRRQMTLLSTEAMEDPTKTFPAR
jgi:hypothetical protein